MQRVPEQSEAGGAPLKLSGLLVTALNDLFWQVGQSSSVEAVALGTGTGDELVEERYCLLARILAFILHHTSLKGRGGGGDNSYFMCTKQPPSGTTGLKSSKILAECSSLRGSPHHVAQPHGLVFGIVLHQ